MLHKNSDFAIPNGSGYETVKRKIKNYIFFLVSYLISLPFYLLVRKGGAGLLDSCIEIQYSVSVGYYMNGAFWEGLRVL